MNIFLYFKSAAASTSKFEGSQSVYRCIFLYSSLYTVITARKYLPNRLVEIALEVSTRLTGIQQIERAADLLYEVGRREQAVELCLSSKLFEKAKALSQGNL